MSTKAIVVLSIFFFIVIVVIVIIIVMSGGKTELRDVQQANVREAGLTGDGIAGAIASIYGGGAG